MLGVLWSLPSACVRCPLQTQDRSWMRGGNTPQWSTLAFPQPAARISDFVAKWRAGASSCGCYENPESVSLGGWWGELQKPEVIASGWLEALAHLALNDIQESKCLNLQSSQGPRWAGRRWRRPPLRLLCLYSPQCKFCFLQSSLFSFVPMSGKRPIILRQKFLSVAGSVARYLHVRNNDWFPLRALWFWYIS